MASALLMRMLSSNNERRSNERVIEFDNGDDEKSRFASNAIKTTKYTPLKFVPLFLKDQFNSFTNWFFLIVICIQQIPGVSPVGKYTTLFPLTTVLTITAMKEVTEDYQRYVRGKAINYRETLVLVKKKRKSTEINNNRDNDDKNDIINNDYSFVKKKWQNVRVGDIINVLENEYIPADLLQLRSADGNGSSYLQTANLDGETNLKIRNSLKVTQIIRVPEDRHCYDGAKIVCDRPNDMIYNFNGRLITGQGQSYDLTIDQLLLKDCLLKNTDWIIGIVVYTGHETKIMKNARSRTLSTKHSTLLRALNRQIIVFVAILAVTIIVCSLGGVWWSRANASSIWYFDGSGERLALNLLTYSILFSFIVPISLQVILEIVRYIQTYFVNNDARMYWPETDTWSRARTSNLNEDLGKVEYIFTDKTGTLTRNVLEFKSCIVKTVVYRREENFDQFKRLLSNSTYHHFLCCICLCNNVKPSNGNDIYYGATPDENVLLKAIADNFDYRLIDRQPDTATVRTGGAGGKELKFNVLLYNEFTSERKCSSILVQQLDDDKPGIYYLYIMGSDESLARKLSPDNNNNKEVDRTFKLLNDFAALGLRTVCMGMVILNEEKLKTINLKSSNNASLLIDSLERDVLLLGATCVEDKLQDSVPETVSILLEAGIRMWMLTGDKLETSINIGYSINFLSKDRPIIILNTENRSELRRIIIDNNRNDNDLTTLIVSGSSLHVLFDSDLEDDFMTFALNCKSVICCRCSPLQKSLIVAWVRYNKTANDETVTLAVGDGANDIAMIQEAVIGVGICGTEGFQAAQAADYAIGQFKYLTRLLLLHGSWSYYRICTLISFCFYKNFLLVVVSAYYTTLCGWSGQILFDEWALISFNVLFTSAPLFIYGTFDKHFDEATLLKRPSLYVLNDWFEDAFVAVLTNGVAHGLFCAHVCLTAVRHEVVWPSGGYNGNYAIDGNTLYTVIIAVICAKFLIHSRAYNWFTGLSAIGSFAAWLVLLMISSFIYPSLTVEQDMVRIIVWMVQSPFISITIVVVTLTTVLIDCYVLAVYRTFYNPYDVSKRKLSTRRQFRRKKKSEIR